MLITWLSEILKGIGNLRVNKYTYNEKTSNSKDIIFNEPHCSRGCICKPTLLVKGIWTMLRKKKTSVSISQK